MPFTERLRHPAVLVALFAIIAAVAVAGWVRRPSMAAPPAGYSLDNAPANPAAYPAANAPNAPQMAGEWDSPYEPATHRTVYRQRENRAAPSAYAPAERTPVERRPHTYVKERPFKKSAEIVAGSAAGGALIGALAGGGKGAAIGALAGGGAGFIYDRATHRKRVTTY